MRPPRRSTARMALRRYTFCSKQLTDVLIELIDRTGIGAKECEMPIDSLDRSELGVGNNLPLRLAIGRWKEHVRRHGHDKDLGFNPVQCRPEVAAGVPAHVGVLRLPCHA